MELENKIKTLCNQEVNSVKEQKILKLLKLVFVDKETDIKRIIYLTETRRETLIKYIEEKSSFLKFITEEEFEIFKNEFDNIINNTAYYSKVFKNVVDDIFNTRYTLPIICKNNFTLSEKFRELLNSEEFFKNVCCDKTKEEIEQKINENALIRQRTPRNMHLIEDKISILITRPDIYFLDSSNYKKLLIVSNYLSSSANAKYMEKLFNTNFVTIVSMLSDIKLKEILKPEYYEILSSYVAKEKIILENNLSEKKQLLTSIINFLQENNFDKTLALLYFKLPENLFDRILDEILKRPEFNQEIKNEIIEMLKNDETKKQIR